MKLAVQAQAQEMLQVEKPAVRADSSPVRGQSADKSNSAERLSTLQAKTNTTL